MMALFEFGRKKEKEGGAPGCPSEGAARAGNSCCPEAEQGVCCVKVLGAGCKSCHEQYEHVKEAVRAMGLSVEVEYLTDMEKIAAYGVMRMPAIVVNERVVSAGKVLKAADVQKLLER